MDGAMDSESPSAGEQASFGVLLKRYRMAAALSQEALAERAGLSARAISAYECGLRQAPYRDTLRQLIQALGLSTQETATLAATVSRRRGPKTTAQGPYTAAVVPRALIKGRTNLPEQLTSFVGRRRELVEIMHLLERTRLLMLTGVGGTGKTRLALRVAAEVLDRYPDGVWLVDLAPLADSTLVPYAVAAATGVRAEPGQPLVATLLAALRARQLLLVIDNCEHLLDACAHLADGLLRACPRVRILATSRQALGIVGEVSRHVPSLAVPAEGHLPPIESLTAYEAIQLFVDRALMVRPSFTVSNQNAPAVAQVCKRLDGIPLALELAAARLRVLSVDQIAQRLDDRFRLLTGGSRTALPRQQTLRATLEWSHALLTEPERILFRRLAVFAGSFDLAAAAAVGDLVDDLDLLTQLVDKSLVVVEEAEETRYRLLETVRQYGREQLDQSGEAGAVRARYRAWYRALAERAEPELSGPRQCHWLDRLECDHDNLRSVLEGSAADPSGLEEGLRMAAALLRLWIVRGYLGEGRHLLAPLLATAAASPSLRQTMARMGGIYAASFAALFQGDYAASGSLSEEWLALARDLGDERGIWLANDMLARTIMNLVDYSRAAVLFTGELAATRKQGYRFGICSALVGLGVLARLQGDHERAVGFCEECLALSREAGDLWFIGQALSNLGLVRYQQGQYGVARTHFGEALEVRRALGDRPGIAWSLINLGDVAQAQGDGAAARARFEESLALLRDLGDRSGRADALASLGRVVLARRDFAAARACYMESLALRRDLGHRLAMPAMLEDLAGLSAARERHARALTLYGAAAALRDVLGAPRSSADRARIERWVGPAWAVLGDVAAAQAWAAGQAMTLEQAIVYAMADEACDT